MKLTKHIRKENYRLNCAFCAFAAWVEQGAPDSTVMEAVVGTVVGLSVAAVACLLLAHVWRRPPHTALGFDSDGCSSGGGSSTRTSSRRGTAKVGKYAAPRASSSSSSSSLSLSAAAARGSASMGGVYSSTPFSVLAYQFTTPGTSTAYLKGRRTLDPDADADPDPDPHAGTGTGAGYAFPAGTGTGTGYGTGRVLQLGQGNTLGVESRTSDASIRSPSTWEDEQERQNSGYLERAVQRLIITSGGQSDFVCSSTRAEGPHWAHV